MNRSLTLVIITLMTVGMTAMAILAPQSSYGTHLNPNGPFGVFERQESKAPIAMSDGNIYIVWWSHVTGNNEVMFRASSDGGATFADKINLSNSTDAESQDAQIAAEGDNVIITWWERNQTAEEPVVRISSDNGASFGPLLKLATNGTIGEATAGEE